MTANPSDIPMDRVWLNAVVASKEAAQRERDVAIRERDAARADVERLRGAISMIGADPEHAAEYATAVLAE